MRPRDLLRHARETLAGGVPQAARIAAVLSRQALEDVVDGLLQAIPPGATMRSRLISLRIIESSEVADLAAAAWCGLSRVCHHHAYELTPTVGEVEHLIGQVEALIIEAGPSR